jgi:hypothetical protein
MPMAAKSFTPSPDGWIDADQWIHVANFVASLFARAPDHRDQMRQRLGQLYNLARKGGPSEFTRVLEIQRMTAGVLRADWRFVWSPTMPLITNDRAMGLSGDHEAGTIRYFVPLGKHFAALIGGRREQKRIRWKNSRWEIEVPLDLISADQARRFNLAMWSICRKEAYGPNRPTMDSLQHEAGLNPEPPPNELLLPFAGGGYLGSTSSDLRNDEMLIYQLIGGIKKPEDPTNPPVLFL